MKSYTINSINGGVNVTFTHDDDTTHTETISGSNVPVNDMTALDQFLKDYAVAWENGLQLTTHDVSAVLPLVGQTILID